MTENEYLKKRLKTLASWCVTRADGDHDPETTLSLLRCKVAQMEEGANKALRSEYEQVMLKARTSALSNLNKP